MTVKDTFLPCWATVELFGRQKIAGELSEETVAGDTFLRVDVPQVEEHPGFSRVYGSEAIYCITPVTEDVARMAAIRLQVNHSPSGYPSFSPCWSNPASSS